MKSGQSDYVPQAEQILERFCSEKYNEPLTAEEIAEAAYELSRGNTGDGGSIAHAEVADDAGLGGG